MTFGGPQPMPGDWVPTVGPWPPRPPAPPYRWWLVGLGLAVLVGVVVGMMIPAVTGYVDQARGYRVGDCVLVEPTSGGELHTTRTTCDTDPSFTVATLADHAGNCSAQGYDRFRPPLADAVTGKLCLVSNLVAGHCYRLGVAMGVWDLSDCANGGPAVIKVTSRLDTDNARACSPQSYLPARTYSSPPRTYCLGLAT